jgi:uncharacterized protein (TIGR00730 family)
LSVKPKKVRKILTNKIRQLYDIVADIDTLLTEMETDFYRVCIFGSARIRENSPIYNQVELLAEALAKSGVDIVTGGGPGLMEAANRGAKAGSKGSWSIGLPIQLPFESDANSHLDVKSHHKRFSSRLDEFMRISHAVIVVPGGIGTVLEMFYTWQLMQVAHIRPRPLILFSSDKSWEALIKWTEDYPLKNNLISPKDMEMIKIVNSVDEIMEILDPDIAKFKNEILKQAGQNLPGMPD